MEIYEYKLFYISKMSKNNIEDELNSLAEQGWRPKFYEESCIVLERFKQNAEIQTNHPVYDPALHGNY